MTDSKPSLAAAIYRYVTLRDDEIVKPTEVEIKDAEHEVDRAALRLVKRHLEVT